MSETDDDSDIDLEFFHRFELHLDSNNNNNDTNRIQVVEESRDRWPRFCLGTLFPKLGIGVGRPLINYSNMSSWAL